MTAAEGKAPTPTPVWKRCLGGLTALALLWVVFRIDASATRPWISAGLAIAIGVLSGGELLLLMARGGRPTALRLGLFGVAAVLVGRAALIVGGWPIGRGDEAILGALFALLLTVEVLRGESDDGPTRMVGTLFVVVYIWSFAFLLDVLLLPASPLGVQLAYLLVLTAKATDIGGYLVGKAIGGKKLLPKVSPGKTWSGFLGGAALAITVAVVGGGRLETPLAMADRVAFGALLAVTAPLGDLAESLLKRWLRAKDSSGLIPTFGGTLDMIDSLVLAAPVGYWFLVARGGIPL